MRSRPWIITASLFLSLLTLEIFCRVLEYTQVALGIRQSPTFITTSDGTIYGVRPNTVTRNRKAVSNSLGLRAPEPHETQHAEMRLLVIGDSVTFGGEVDTYSTFSAVLQSKFVSHHLLKQPVVINAGIPGYSIFNERNQYRRLKDLYNPQHVIIQFCANDIVEPWLHWNQFVNGGISADEIPREAIPNEGYHRMLLALHNSRALFELRRRVDQLRDLAQLLGSPKEEPHLTGEDIIRVDRFSDGTAPEIQWLRNHYRGLINEIRQDGREVSLLVVPLQQQISEGKLSVSRKPQEIMNQVALENDVRLLDTTQALEETFTANSDEKLFVDQWHLSSAGHRVVADTLFAALSN